MARMDTLRTTAVPEKFFFPKLESALYLDSDVWGTEDSGCAGPHEGRVFTADQPCLAGKRSLIASDARNLVRSSGVGLWGYGSDWIFWSAGPCRPRASTGTVIFYVNAAGQES